MAPALAQTNPQVPQGGSASFYSNGASGPSNSSADIVNPSNSVIASFNSSSGGSNNGWTLNATTNFGGTVLFLVTAPTTATIGSGYKVRAMFSESSLGNAYGYGYAYKSATFDIISGQPSAPTGLQANAGQGSVFLQWNITSNTTGYILKRSQTPGTGYTQIATPTGVSYTDSGVTNGTPYYYVVQATNSMGTSSVSNEATATPASALPSAPTGLSATARDGQVELSWGVISGATSYKVKRSATNGGSYSVIETRTTTSYTDTSVLNGRTYYYVVTAVNGDGEGSPSNQASATPQSPPTAPLTLSGIAGDALVYLTWTSSVRATSYEVWRSGAGASWVLVATVSTNSHTDTGLDNGVVYEYFVRAVNSSGPSQDSNRISLIPNPASPYAPAVPTFSNITQTTVDVTAPGLPMRATSLALQRRLNAYYGPATYQTVATGLGAGSVITATGLTPNTSYSFRFVAVGTGGSTPGSEASVTTLPPAPLAPEAPRFRNAEPTSLTVLTPPLPTYATSLTLQRKLQGDPDSSYVAVGTGLSANSSTTASGLTAATAYIFRFIAVGNGGSTAGPGASVTTPPPAPGAPTFGAKTPTSVVVIAPALPTGAGNLTLQRQTGYSSSNNTFYYTDVASGLAGGASTLVNGLLPGSIGGDDGPSSGYYTFRYVAVGAGGGTPGSTATVSLPPPAPGAPSAPLFSSVSNSSVFVAAPGLPAYASSLTLQRKLQGTADSTYVDVQTNVSGGATVVAYGLSAATTYTFRFVAVNSGGSTAGPGADVTTPPPAPGAPSFSNTTQTSTDVTAPSLPTGATSLTLQRRIASTYPSSVYQDEATGLSGGATTTVSGLTAGTQYTFRYVAINSGGGTPGSDGNVTTAPPAPGAPGAPLFSNITPTSLVIIAPNFPAYANSLNLQQKLASDPDSSYANVATGIYSGNTTSVSSLTPGEGYSFRYVAVGTGGSTPGTAASITMPPAAPGAPSFSNTTSTSTLVTAPSSPAGATSLSLQRKLNNQSDSTYITLATGLAGSDSTTASDLTPSTQYTFRYVAVGAGGSTSGSTGNVTTSSSSSGVPGAATFTSVSSTSLYVLAPPLPSGASSLTLQKKLASDPDTSYADVATGLSGNQSTSVTGLSAGVEYSFRYVAMSGSVAGPGTNVTTLPAAPGVPTFGSITWNSAVATLPALPAGATSLALQQRVYVSGNYTYVTVASGQAGGATVNLSGLAPSSGYTYRCLAVNSGGAGAGGGSTAGSDANFYTQTSPPADPAPPTFANVGPTSLTAVAPSLPQYASSLTLQRKLQGADDSTYVNVQTGISYAGQTISVSGLTANTSYTLRFVAINSSGSTAGAGADVTTTPPAPGAPAFSSTTSSSTVVTAPTLPTGASSLTLQRRTGSGPYGNTYVEVASGLSGGATTAVSDLTPNTQYTFRYLALSGAGSTAGSEASITTLQPAPDAPDVAIFRDVTTTSLTVQAPSLPSYANSLTLQRKLQGADDSTYANQQTNVYGGNNVFVFGLTANTSYTFRFIAVGSGGSTTGVGADVTTAPTAPGVPTFSNITQTGVRVTAPALPAGALSLTLQHQVGSPYEYYGSYVDVASGLMAGDYTDASDLTPASTYTFRYVAVGTDDSTAGSTANVITLPPAPGMAEPPHIVNVAQTTLTATAPGLPPYATSLTLQRKLQGADDSTYVSITTNLSAGAQTSVTGLTDSTAYTFRYLVVGLGGSTGGTPIDVTTLPPLPGTPGAPSLSNIGTTTLTATLPATLPSNTTSLTLQYQSYNGNYTTVDVASGLSAGDTINVTGLAPGMSYTFYCVAVGPGGSTTSPGAGANTAGGAPNAPGLPQFSNLDRDGVDVLAPAMPVGANSLTLQRKLTSEADSAYTNVLTSLTAGSVTSMVGLDTGQSYSFRYIAVGYGGSTAGPGASVTMPAAVITWGAGTAIDAGGIRYPLPGSTLAQGAEGRLNAYLATDLDLRGVTLNGNTITTEHSDPCSYTWSATGGSFKSGVNTGQSVVWVAPSTPGTYTITLIVDDQASANKAAGEGGSRSDAQRGYNDEPILFTTTIVVP